MQFTSGIETANCDTAMNFGYIKHRNRYAIYCSNTASDSSSKPVERTNLIFGRRYITQATNKYTHHYAICGVRINNGANCQAFNFS